MTVERTATYVCPVGHRTQRTVLGRPPEVAPCREKVGVRTECSREARLVAEARR